MGFHRCMSTEYILDILNEEGTFKFEVLLQTEESTFFISQTFDRPIIFNFVNLTREPDALYVPSAKQKEIEYIYNCTVFPVVHHLYNDIGRMFKIVQPYLLNADYISYDIFDDKMINIIQGGMKITHRHGWFNGKTTYKRGRCELQLYYDISTTWKYPNWKVNITKFTHGMIGYYPIRNGWYNYKIGDNRIITNVGFNGDVGRVTKSINVFEIIGKPRTYYPFGNYHGKDFNLKRSKKCVRQVKKKKKKKETCLTHFLTPS